MLAPYAANLTPPVQVQAAESENIALNKPTMATAGNSSRAVDGDISSYWDGGVAPSQLIVDLEGYYSLDKIVVVPYYAGSRYYHYEVYASVDGISYDLVGEKTDNEKETSAGRTFEQDGSVYRYVKVNMTYNSSNPSVHINELQVYGTEQEDYEVSGTPSVDVNDPDNVAFAKPTRSNTNSRWSMLAVDGNPDSTWAGEDYPKYVDVDLMANYDIDSIKVYLPEMTDGKSNPVEFSYTVYGSLDGANFTEIARCEPKAPTADGDTFEFETPLNYRVIRVNVTSNSKGEGANSLISEIKVYGEKNETEVTSTRDRIEFDSYEDWLLKNYDVNLSEIKAEDGSYSMSDTYTDADVFETVEGLITRILGEEYIDWFSFELAENESGKDFYEISNDADGKIHIKGNEGLSITSGLNHYLKYYCNVHVSQQTSQVTMPDAIVPVDKVITKESPYEVRYAYNYCTLSYTMPFWGYDEWQRELDYLALNGVNLILDTTATEALWIQYLMNYGYDVDEAKAFVCGYSYKAWWLMGNLEGYGGTVGDQWVLDTVEMARRNQRYMTVLGMQPCLQGFMGALPEHFADVANDTLTAKGYSDIAEYMVAQGDWSGFTRPPILKTTYDGYDELAETFYDTQEYIYGQVTKYYAGDLAHEGGILPEDLSKAEMSAHILDLMIEADKDAVWVIQSWLSNPNKDILEGFGEKREDHVIVLDLDSTENPHWDNTTNWNGKEFGGTSWVYCMLDNYGGRTGMHGELLTLATQIAYAQQNSEHMKGIGITPEGTELNSVNYDLFWEMVWETDAIDLDQWIKHYVTRRYGSYSENIYQAWQLLIDTAYGSCKEDGTFSYHAGCVNCIINMRPSFSPEIVIGDYKLRYDPVVFEEAVKLFMSEFDNYKDVECYIFDVVDMLRQLVANTEVAYFELICDAYNTGNSEIFAKYKEKLLASILLLDEISSYQEDGLVGHWIEKVENWVTDERNGEYDDYSKEMMEINAKAIISAWSSKTLQTYGHRQYSGMLEDYNYKMWSYWLDAVEEAMQTGSYQAPTTSQDYFNFAWDFVINGKDYTTTVSNPEGDENARGLMAIYKEITENHLTGQAVKDTIIDDNVALEGKAYAETTLGSNSASRLNDGDTSKLWIASGTSVPVYCGIELSSFEDVYGLQLTAETRATLGANVMDYYIEARQEDGSWEKIYTGKTFDEEKQCYTVNIMLDDIVTTDNIRVTFTTNGGIYPALAELKVYSSKGILVISEELFVIEDGKLVGLEPGETVADIRNNIYHGKGEVVFYDADGNEMADDAEVTVGTTLKLIYNGFVLEEVTVNVLGLDRSGLEKLFGNIEKLDRSIYTEASVAKLDTALQAAKDVYENESVNQEQLNAAEKALLAAFTSLKYVEDRIVKENVALKGTAYAESTLGSYAVSRLNDGETGKIWIAGSNAVPVYCGIRFNEYVEIDALELVAETRNQPGANVMDYYVKAKNENGKWVTIYEGDTYDKETKTYTTKVTLPESIKTNDVRVTFTTNGGIYPALAELSLYQVAVTADYSAVEAALAKVPEDLSIYTEESVAALQEAIAAVEEGKMSDEQDAVDAMAAAINEAIEALVLKDQPVEVVFEITKQPENVTVSKGSDAAVTVEATGKELTYTWYYKNPGNKKFYVSGSAFADGNTYSIPMYAWRDGQQVYCVITDADGNTLTSDIVTLSLVKANVTITKQPVDTVVKAAGETAVVTVEATGENLTYTWYYKNPGNVKFYVSGTTFADGNTYSIPMNKWRDGQQVYCVITDGNGNTVQTTTVTLGIEK